MEVWVMLADRYEVSNLGRFRRRNISWPKQRRTPQYRYIKGSLNQYGYRQVVINGRWRLRSRVVLEAFVGPCPEGLECDHKNRKQDDDRLVNLHWVTHSENMLNRRKWTWKKPKKIVPRKCKVSAQDSSPGT